MLIYYSDKRVRRGYKKKILAGSLQRHLLSYIKIKILENILYGIRISGITWYFKHVQFHRHKNYGLKML